LSVGTGREYLISLKTEKVGWRGSAGYLDAIAYSPQMHYDPHFGLERGVDPLMINTLKLEQNSLKNIPDKAQVVE
jgi:hypothetical protein